MIPVMFALRPFIPRFSRDHITVFNFFILKVYPSLLEAFNQLDIFLIIKTNCHAFQSRPASSTHTRSEERRVGKECRYRWARGRAARREVGRESTTACD